MMPEDKEILMLFRSSLVGGLLEHLLPVGSRGWCRLRGKDKRGVFDHAIGDVFSAQLDIELIDAKILRSSIAIAKPLLVRGLTGNDIGGFQASEFSSGFILHFRLPSPAVITKEPGCEVPVGADGVRICDDLFVDGYILYP